MLLVVMFLPSYLDVHVYEQLNVFVGRQVHRHFIDYIPKCALNDVFNSALLETIVLVLLRGKWTPGIPGDMVTLMVSNLSVETKTSLRIDWQHTYVTGHEGCAIFIGRSGDWLPKLWKATSGMLGGWLTTGTTLCIAQPGLLRIKTVQCTNSVSSNMQPANYIA